MSHKLTVLCLFSVLFKVIGDPTKVQCKINVRTREQQHGTNLQYISQLLTTCNRRKVHLQAWVVCISSAWPRWTVIPQMFTHTAEGLAKWSTVTQCEDSLQKQYEYETREMHMCGEADSFIKPKKKKNHQVERHESWICLSIWSPDLWQISDHRDTSFPGFWERKDGWEVGGSLFHFRVL